MHVISHRARGFGHAENSVHAVREALHAAIDGIEIDIRLTKDRKWVVIHNTSITTERKEVLRVHHHSLRQLRHEVTDLDAILALFAAFGEKKELYLDVKDVGEHRQLVRLLHRHKVQSRVIIIAWEPEVLKRVHKLDPTLRLGLSYVPIHSTLSALKTHMTTPVSGQRLLLSFNEMHSFDAKFGLGVTHQHYLATLPDLPLYSIQVPGLFCSRKLVDLAHARGIRVIPFFIGGLGVNTRLAAAVLRRRGVDAILTDTPLVFHADT